MDKTTIKTTWRLREIMDQHGVTGYHLALLVGVSPSLVSRWRRADKMPSMSGDRLDQIAVALSALTREKITPCELIKPSQKSARD